MRARIRNNLVCITDKHHVPPRHADPRPRFTLKKDRREHEAYHLLFGCAKSFEDACEILYQDWWRPLDTG